MLGTRPHKLAFLRCKLRAYLLPNLRHFQLLLSPFLAPTFSQPIQMKSTPPNWKGDKCQKNVASDDLTEIRSAEVYEGDKDARLLFGCNPRSISMMASKAIAFWERQRSRQIEGLLEDKMDLKKDIAERDKDINELRRELEREKRKTEQFRYVCVLAMGRAHPQKTQNGYITI